MKFKNIKTNNIISASQEFIDSLPDVQDWEEVIDVPYIPTFDELKEHKIKELHDKYQAEYDNYLAKYPKREVDTFGVKQAEATAYTLDNTSPTPVIDSIVAGTGEDRVAYIESVMQKVTYLAMQEGEMVSVRDAIKACTTQEELDAILI